MAPTSVEWEASTGDTKRSYVRQMFTAIAPRYDFLNHLLSLNVDRWWRRRAVRTLGWERRPAGCYLDLCAGTLDLAAALIRRPRFQGRVIGADFAVPMLTRGRRKAPQVRAVGADALCLPFADGTFDGAMVAFGIRNLTDVDAGLREAARILRPGARLVVLEFTTPRFPPFRAAYLLYFRKVLPWIGRAVSGHASAYAYLPASVMEFPGTRELAERIQRAGFEGVRFTSLTGGVAAVHWGTRREAV